MMKYKCPFAERVPLQCDFKYCLDEFHRQLTEKLHQGQTDFIKIGGDDSKFVCKNEPEICPRYVQHLITNITVYKQR